MHDGRPSVTAQRVAASRLGFDRLPAPFGDPSADERLALDVARSAAFARNESMGRYLRGRTSFFDRVVVNALDRDVSQVVAVGAGYDGRPLRYAKPGVRWFEVDHPDTQRDKRVRLGRLGIEAPQITFIGSDLGDAGFAAALLESGYQADAPSLILCEGVAVYLDQPVLKALLRELRAVATVGTRLAITFSISLTSEEQSAGRERFRAAVATVGEPVRNALTADGASRLLSAARWHCTELSERARRAGFVVAAPSWVPDAEAGSPPTASRVGAFMERTLHRSGTDSLSGHLESTYGIEVARMRELDVGVFRVDRRDGPSWVARVFPAARPLQAAEGDAEILRWLQRIGFPAERCANHEPVSTHQGQGVVVTEYAPGKTPTAGPPMFRMLGGLLGRLHALPPGPGALARPGGAWHHLVLQGAPREEIAAATVLLDDARPRVPVAQRAAYLALRKELEGADDCHDLPHALIHPDFVPPNVVASSSGDPLVVDWTGAGHGPRLWSLGFLLWAAAPSRPCIDAVISGYRSHVRLEPDELERLAPAIGARPLVFGCWAFATGRERFPDLVDSLPVTRARAAAVAGMARAALQRSAG